ncbi:calcium-binding protein [Actinoplanes sp. NPDC024001]|uniref:calcium-binding protein n=1 Tax=Actinoplanes sp. NPDC024001 TaxID=3154598 RepID=UPI00340866AD
MTRFVWPARVAVGLLATAGLGLAAAPAQAASTGVVSLQGGLTVKYVAAKKATNRVVVTHSGKTVTIDDRVKIKAGSGCKAVKGDKTKVRCTGSSLSALEVILRDKSDSVVNKSALKLQAWGGTGNDTLTGGSRSDTLLGESGSDKLYGLGGFDALHGGSGADRLYGGTEGDALWGESGTDVLYGGKGNDGLNGGTGNDKEYGQSGNDSFTTGNAADGADLLVGSSGEDDAYYAGRRTPVTLDADGRKGDDGAKGERDTLSADIEVLTGGQADDVLVGSSAANRIRGQAGNDRIYGAGGNDLLHGQLGNDRVYGGAGNDRIWGTEGQDSLYGEAGNDDLDGDDFSTDTPDRLDGGPNTDVCRVFPGDVAVNCES